MKLTIRKIDDMHVHLRQGEMLQSVLPFTMSQCARALVMPNTMPPIINVEDVVNYRKAIVEAKRGSNDFEPLMTFKVVPSASPDEVRALKQAGAIAGKLYPEGVTTNSDDGVGDFDALYPVYEEMEKEGLVLCLHGEMPGVFSLDREHAFLDVLIKIANDFPSLKIVLEHATTASAIATVKALPENVACTLTVHHMYITLDDLVGDKLNPHVFCKPIAKRPEDRDAVLDAALSGNPKFFFGSDSAPHTIASKECACGAAGVYSAPILLPALCQLFERNGALERLQPFTSEFGANFYGLPLNTSMIELSKKRWTVPDQYDGVRPFLAGSQLDWQLD
ncbi:MAG: dihydroorotase [Candidatus Obscuribacterales bacterium]|nr:dihydroorotase [Candidatus Obscuribacterales bacterium]